MQDSLLSSSTLNVQTGSGVVVETAMLMMYRRRDENCVTVVCSVSQGIYKALINNELSLCAELRNAYARLAYQPDKLSLSSPQSYHCVPCWEMVLIFFIA